MSDWSELKRLAESVPDNYSNETAQYVIFSDAADPQAILALIAENERNQERADAEAESFDSQRRVLDMVKAERDQLRAEIEALREECNLLRLEKDSTIRQLRNSDDVIEAIKVIIGRLADDGSPDESVTRKEQIDV